MKRENSSLAFREACRYIPGGVNSPVRAFKSVGGEPVFVKKASGCRIWDEDDNEYIDCIGSWGPMLLGHNHPAVLQAIGEHAPLGLSYGLPTRQETEAARLISEAYPCAELVRMVNSGTEATMSAIRAARGFTGRDKIIKFEGCYHGHSDGLLVQAGSGAMTFGSPTSPGVPADVVKNTLVCTYNSIQSVQQAFAANPRQIACVILEPIAGNMGLVPGDAAFLQALRDLCTQEGAVLIFDEVISGFRAAYGGAAEVYGIQPDMVCFGKIIGAGLPVGCYAGKREIMSVVSPSGPVYQAGTLSGNPLAMACGIAMLSYLKQNREVYARLQAKGARLAEGLRKAAEGCRVPCRIVQSGSLLCLFFTNREVHNYDDALTCDTEAFGRWHKAMLEQGILLAPSQFECIFLSDAHTEEDIDRIIAAAQKALREV